MIIHIDTAGQEPESLGKNQYMVLCVEEHSGYILVRFAKTKLEIPDLVKSIVSQVELETGNEVTCLFTDNGTEYTNMYLRIWTGQKEILHEYSAAYTPQQTGHVERAIRFVKTQAKTMLIDRKLPENLWGKGMCHNCV